MQLISSVLRDKQVTRRLEGKAFRVAYPRSVALGGRECLVGFVGIITPDAAPSLQLSAGIVAGDLGLPVLRLAGICWGCNAHKHGPIGSDNEGRHGMIAAEGPLGDDRFSGVLGHD